MASALAYGDSNLPRAWSRYTDGTSSNKAKFNEVNARTLEFHGQKVDVAAAKKAKREAATANESKRLQREKKLLKDLYMLKEGRSEDVEKQEFWNVMGPAGNKRSWANDGGTSKLKGKGATPKPSKVTAKFTEVEGKMYGAQGAKMNRSHLTFDESDDEYQEIVGNEDGGGPAEEAPDLVPTVARTDEAVNEAMSDLEYMRSKMKPGGEANDPGMVDAVEDAQAAATDPAAKPKRENKKKRKKAAAAAEAKEAMDAKNNTTVRLRGLPFTATEVRIGVHTVCGIFCGDLGRLLHVQAPNFTPLISRCFAFCRTATQDDVREFFHPLTPNEVRMTKDRFDRPSGRAYCDFNLEDVPKALKYDHDHMGDRFIEVTMDDEGKPELLPAVVKEPRKFPQTEVDVGALAESGRLFVRNLAYACKEDHLRQLFSKFGPLSEVQIPIDRETKKSKAIAFITFLMPEHAVVAYQALDGQPYQGRLLHLLPSKEKRETGVISLEDAPSQGQDNYKKRQDAKRKANDSSFNWNTLFMRSDTVADAMATSYGVDKSDILDKETDSSIAVRMALGETHIVAENKLFLQTNGVKLDAFDARVFERSTTLILVKNTPFETQENDLRTIFAKHGSVGRVIIPPSKTMAIVEMFEDSEARTAFRSLAYRKFKHVPLYLEWAPAGCLEAAAVTEAANAKGVEEEDGEEGGETDGETGSTLFIKNLNFNTSDDDLAAFFERCTAIRSARIARKKDPKNPSKMRSMGFGFVEFPSDANAMKALKALQNNDLDGHKLQLKLSKNNTEEKREVKGQAITVGGTKLFLGGGGGTQKERTSNI